MDIFQTTKTSYQAESSVWYSLITIWLQIFAVSSTFFLSFWSAQSDIKQSTQVLPNALWNKIFVCCRKYSCNVAVEREGTCYSFHSNLYVDSGARCELGSTLPFWLCDLMLQKLLVCTWNVEVIDCSIRRKRLRVFAVCNLPSISPQQWVCWDSTVNFPSAQPVVLNPVLYKLIEFL